MQTIRTRTGVSLAVHEAGPPDAPVLLLLHGFPDGRRCWDRALPRLSSRYRVITYDQRGYCEADRPLGVEHYRPSCMVADAIDVLDALGIERAHLVGHDWGGLITWILLLAHPERFLRACVLNCPHPLVGARFNRRSWQHRLRSAYWFLIRRPWLPELIMRWRDFAIISRQMRSAYSPAELALLKRGWREPGVLTAMLNWYRALPPDLVPEEAGRVRVPVRVLWGAADPVLRSDMAAPSAAECDEGDAILIDGAGHWVHRDAPAPFFAAVEEWLARPTGSVSR